MQFSFEKITFSFHHFFSLIALNETFGGQQMKSLFWGNNRGLVLGQIKNFVNANLYLKTWLMCLWQNMRQRPLISQTCMFYPSSPLRGHRVPPLSKTHCSSCESGFPSNPLTGSSEKDQWRVKQNWGLPPLSTACVTPGAMVAEQLSIIWRSSTIIANHTIPPPIQCNGDTKVFV